MGIQRLYAAWSPYTENAARYIDYAQTADRLYSVHLNYPVYSLTRTDHTEWDFSEVVFGPTIDPPDTPTIAATTPNMDGYIATTYRYKITAVRDSAPAQESRPSAMVSVANDLTLSGNYNTLTLPAKPAGVDRYVIYKEQAGAYGYIGGTDGSTFRDGNPQIQPILSDTPPVGDNPFDGYNNYPSAVTFHQQRLMLGRTLRYPNAVWGSQSSDYENMDKSRPAKADDAISFALVSTQVNAVNLLASFDELLVLSGDAIWAVSGAEGNVLTQQMDPKKIINQGVSRLKTLEIGKAMFYQPSKGGGVRTLGFTFEYEGYQSNNVSIFSPHLFEGRRIVSWAYQEEPFACIWAVLDDGKLLCFTWEAEQQVWGWSVCETDGEVLRVAVITEDGYDRLYATIRRTIANQTRVFYERMALPHMGDLATACHLDCSITQVYDPPRNKIDQLWHLEGAMVSVHYDGYAAKDILVQNGSINLPHDFEAYVVTVGLPYEGEVETLPAQLGSSAGSFHVNRQQIGEVVVRTVDTKGIEIGAGGTELQQVEERDGTEVAELPDVAARDYRVSPPGNWEDTSTVVIRQREPFPAEIVGIFYNLKVS